VKILGLEKEQAVFSAEALPGSDLVPNRSETGVAEAYGNCVEG